MGGLCKSSSDKVPTSSTVVQGTQIPEWVSEAGKQTFEEARALAQNPYTAYEGPRVAPLSQYEQTAFNVIGNDVGSQQGYMDDAKSLVDTGTQQWSNEVADKYMNPYQKQVTDIAARELTRQHDMRGKDRGAAAVAAGGFGGAQHGVMEAEAGRNLDLSLGDLYLRGGQAGYEQARQGFNADRQAALSGAGALGSLAQADKTLTGTDASRLAAAGQTERNVAQRSADTAYSDFLEARQWPYEQINFVTGALSGVPYETTSTQTGSTQQVVPQQSMLGQVGGLGLVGAGIGNLAGWWG